MVKHKGFTAWISVGGKQVVEYATEIEPDGRKATSWIVSQPGKNFAVNWFDHGSRMSTASYIVLDGFTTPGRFLHGYGGSMRTGARAGPNTERPFVFAEIPKNARIKSKNINEKDVGTIVLKIAQVQRGPGRPSESFQVLPPTISRDLAPVTGGHCVTYGKQELPCHPQYNRTWTATPLDENDNRSFVKFIWKYRPIEYMTEQGLFMRPMPVVDMSTVWSVPPAVSMNGRQYGPPFMGNQPVLGATPAFVLAAPMGGYCFLKPSAPPPQSLSATEHPLYKIPVGTTANKEIIDLDTPLKLPDSDVIQDKNKNKGKGKDTSQMARSVSPSSSMDEDSSDEECAGRMSPPPNSVSTPASTPTPTSSSTSAPIPSRT